MYLKGIVHLFSGLPVGLPQFVKSGLLHTQFPHSLHSLDLARVNQGHDSFVIGRLGDRGPAEHYPLRLGNSDAFLLPPMDLDTLLLGYAGHHFNQDVRHHIKPPVLIAINQRSWDVEDSKSLFKIF